MVVFLKVFWSTFAQAGSLIFLLIVSLRVISSTLDAFAAQGPINNHGSETHFLLFPDFSV